MLLSFYDLYLNDNFIEEKYDAPGNINLSSINSSYSPGIKQESDWREQSTPYTNYGDFVDDYADEFLHLKLVQIGKDELNLYNDNSQNQSIASGNKPVETGWEINMYELKDVINEYFAQFNESNEELLKIKNNVTVNILSYYDEVLEDDPERDEYIRNEMIAKIQAGIPVIYSGEPVTGNMGHCLIAYDYDVMNDTIYFHTGWNGNIHMTDKDADAFIYNTETSIIWFDINEENLSHNHTDNYTYSSLDSTVSLCACQLFSEFSQHSHYLLLGYDENEHYLKCNCGEKTNISPHNLTYPERSTNTHVERCIECGYKERVAHIYDTLQYNDGIYHRKKCACNIDQGEFEEHYAYSYEKYDSKNHYVYCECGHLIGTNFHIVPAGSAMIKYCIRCGQRLNMTSDIVPMPGTNAISNIKYITDAGSYIGYDGIIYLVESDMALYLAGELDVYALAESINAYPTV